ncbi:conserved Plasmodium protein, unknown function [Plasmodium gallinaceum]|uniref:Uncharacterized protein n=1 Tax=Plasmodium gallinaceum TaxID=5849 RepID=A0A1J1GWU8_PLAGA|nr:conserved Plasmodium protein, unknown function [Plasmodium gallinaceum]CRG97035.1 conserved Plasmodium protein, unknown function [Plasmodium gallinaceum]
MKSYSLNNLDNKSINNIYKKLIENNTNHNINNLSNHEECNTDEKNMKDEIVNEVLKLKTELKNVLMENNELKKKYNEDTEKLNLVALKNATILNEVSDEKKTIQIEYNNYKIESMKDIKRLQDELDKNVIMLNCLKDEILFKEEELRKAEVIEKLYKQETEMNQEKDIKIKNLEKLLNEKNNISEQEAIDRLTEKNIKEEIELIRKELEKKNNELIILNKKYENLKKTNREIERKISFLKEEVDYYKNNENSFIMQNIFNSENNLDDSICKKNLMKIYVLYNVLYKIILYDQRSLLEKEKFAYSLEKENTHFLKKFITDEIYCQYLKDCISKINLTYQIDLHKQEKKYMILNSEYDILYNKFLHEKNENCLLNEKYENIIYNQKAEINNLKSHISTQDKDKEILTKYIDNYITYIENSYEKYCILKNDYKNLEESFNDLEEKNKNLMNLVNGNDKYANILFENNNLKTKNTITLDIDHIKLIKNDIKDKDIQIIELESRNLELEKQIDKLNEELLKNKKNKYTENESLKLKELCYDLKDICSKLELENKEKNYIIDDLTEKLSQAEKKNKDNQVILELSEFRIQNFNDNVKYYQQKVNELSEKLQKKEEEIAIFQDYNERLKDEKEKMVFENEKIIKTLEEIQEENDNLKKERNIIRNNILDNSALLLNDIYYSNENPIINMNDINNKISDNESKEEKGNIYKDILKLKQSKKKVVQEKNDLEAKIDKLTDENILLIKENEEVFDKLQMLSKENIKMNNELIRAKADAEKSLFYLDREKKEKLKYKLLLRKRKRKNKKMYNIFNKMMNTVRHLIINIKKIDKENKKNDINNSFFISSSSEDNFEEGMLSANDNSNTQLILSSITKSKNSNNNTSIDGKNSMQSKSTKVFKLPEDISSLKFIDKGKNIHKRKKKKTVYMRIRMHRFSICNNFKINLIKYKKAYKELNNTLYFLNEKKNDNLNILEIQSKNVKTLETFYSLPNSTDSKIITHEKKKKKENDFSFFEIEKLINDINYVNRKYESKVKETLIMQKKLIDNEKEFHNTNIKYENLLNEHDSLISDIKERTEKLSTIEKDYNLLFVKYNETQDEIKMHEQKTQEIFNECNELVEYMKKKENKIKEFDEHIKKIEIKYKEEKEKNDILTKDNISLDNLNSKYKEDIELYKKKWDSMQTELKLRLSKIEELELIQKNAENEIFYLKSATYKFEMNLKEAHDELNRTNESVVKLKKEVNEKKMNIDILKEQIIKRDYFLYNINKSYKSKEYFYKNLKQRVQGFNKTFIELCENFEMSEIKKFNELYEDFEYNDNDYKKNVSNFLMNKKEAFLDTAEEIVKKVDVLAEFNSKYEEEKKEMINKIKELENKLNIKMNENNLLYEQYENNLKNILVERDERVEDCIILSEDVKKKNNEINILMKDLEDKNIELNEVNMKCTFLSNEVQNLENAKNHLKEKLRDIETNLDKQIDILKKENDYLRDDVYNLKNIIHNLDNDIIKLKDTVDNLNQEKYEYEKEIDKLREIIEEEKKFNDILKENEQNFIKEIKEAHLYAVTKEEEINTLKLNYELEQKKYIDQIDKLKIQNDEINNSVKNKLKVVSDLEAKMLEYKVLLDKNTSMKMLVQDLENKIDDLIKDNEKLSVDLKKEKILGQEKEKNIVSLNENIKIFEKKILEHDSMLLKLKDEKEQLNQEILILNDIKKNKDHLIEELENNLRRAVFGDIKISEIEKTKLEHKIFTEEDLGLNGDVDFNDLVNSKLCIFNNNNNNINVKELKKYSLLLKEENDNIKQELRKLKDKLLIDERKNVEMERTIERRDEIIRKMNNEIISYNEKIKNLEKDTSQLNSELYAVNELLALRSDECKELSMELYELTDVKNKLITKNEVFQKQIEFFKQQIEEKSEILNDLDMKKVENDYKENEKNNIINEYNKTLNFYYKICSHIIYYKKYIEKELNTKDNVENEILINSLNLSNVSDSINNELTNLKINDTNEISDYINEFLKCVRLLIFKKRVFESKLENAEKKYNDFKEKLKEDRELINDLKKKLRQNEEYNLNNKNSYDNNQYNKCVNNKSPINYKETIFEILNSDKNKMVEEKNNMFLKYENEKLIEENKYLNDQIHNLYNLQNSVNELKKKKEKNENDNEQTDYTYVAENKCLKLQIETVNNELNIYKNKNEYLKKKIENYEEIIDNLQNKIINIIDKQKECDEEFYKMEKELERKSKYIENLIKKRKEDQESLEIEYSKSLKFEKEFLSLNDEIFKKESKIKEYEEILKKLNEDIKEHIKEKEQLKEYVENMKTKYELFENKYNEPFDVFEKEKERESEIKKKDENDLLGKLKNYDEIITNLLDEKAKLLHKYDELKKIFDEKLKTQSMLHEEISELKKINEDLSEKNNSLSENVKNLVKENEQYNMKFLNLDKEKLDLYMKYLKASEELNNISSSNLHEKSNLKKNDDKLMNSLLLIEKEIKEKEENLEIKLNSIKKYDGKNNKKETEDIEQQKDIIIKKIKGEINDLTIENDLLKVKISELESLNKNIFNDNKELIKIISSIDGKNISDKNDGNLKILEIENSNNYKDLVTENKLEKEENENLKLEINNLKYKIDEYKIIMNKNSHYEKSYKKVKNYLFYLNDKIKTFIEIFNESNFNYEYFRTELKKIKSTNLMIIEDVFESIDGIASKKNLPSDYSLDDDNSSIYSQVIVNFFTAYNNERHENDIIINREELNKFYKFIIKLKEEYKKKCLLTENQKYIIEELNKEVFNYSKQNGKHQEEKEKLRNRINEIINENSMNIEEFSKMRESLLNKLEEEINKNKKLSEEKNVENKHSNIYEKIQIKVESPLSLKNIDDNIKDEEKDNRNLNKISILLDEYKELIESRSKLLVENNKFMSENDTLKEVIKNMDEKINNLIDELNEKNIVINNKNFEIEQMNLDKTKYSKNETNNVIREYEEIILIIEQKNNELENKYEKLKKCNNEVNSKYNNLFNEYNSLKDFLKEKKNEASVSDLKEKDNVENDISENKKNKENITNYIESLDLLKDNNSLTLKKHINLIELLNNDFIKNSELENFINLLKKDINSIMNDNYYNELISTKNELIKKIKEKENEVKNYEIVINNMNLCLDNKEEEIDNLKYIYEEELRIKENLQKKLDESHKQKNSDIFLKNEEMFLKIESDYETLLNEYKISLHSLEEANRKLEELKNEKEENEKIKEKEVKEKELIIKNLESINNQLEEKINEIKKSLNEELELKENVIKKKLEILDTLNNEIKFLNNEKNTNNTYIKELELKVANSNNEISTLDSFLKDSKEEINFIKNLLNEKENEISELKQKIDNYINHVNDSNICNKNLDVNNRNINETETSKKSEEIIYYENEIDHLKKSNQIENDLHYKKLNELRTELKNSFTNYNKLKFDTNKKIEEYEEEAKNLKYYMNILEEENEKKNKKYALVEIAIKEMDNEIKILKDDIDQKNMYIKDLENTIEKNSREMEILEEDTKILEHKIITYIESKRNNIEELINQINNETKTKYLSFIKNVMIKVHQNYMKKELKEEIDDTFMKKEKDIISLEETLNKMISEKNKYEKEINEKKQELNILNDKKNSCNDELNNLINEYENKKKEINNKLNEIDMKEKNIIHKENELMHQNEKFMIKESELIKRKEELVNRENELIQNKEDLINKTNELMIKKEELNNDKIHMEELKNDLMIKFEKLYSAHNDIKMKETKLKKIYEKLKDHNIIELLDVNNNESVLNDSLNNNIKNSPSLKKLAEDDVDNENESLNLDSLEYTTYFKEFKKRIKNLKSDLINREKDLEIYKKTFEIEKKEKEIYKIELEKLKELLNIEQMNKKNIDEELAKYKSDDTNILTSLKESEALLNEKNKQILDLQQKLIEFSNEINILDNNKNLLQEKNDDYEKKIEDLNSVIKDYEKEINELNKEKLSITKKSIEKIIYDGEDIKKLKDNLDEAHELIINLKNKNEELYNINIELQQANKDMRCDIDILLANIENMNDEKIFNEKKIKEDEVKYNELKIIYEEKVEECKKIFNMLSLKMKKKLALEKEQEGGKLENNNINNSIVSIYDESDVDQDRKIFHELNQKNKIIESLNDKISQYDKENLKKQEIIYEYKNIINNISSKIHIFEENLHFLIQLNEFINENDCSYENVLLLLKDSMIYKKILNKILYENQFYNKIILIKECLFDMIRKNTSSVKETLKLSLLKKKNSKKMGDLIDNNPLYYSENLDSFHKTNEELTDNLDNKLKNIDDDFGNFENVCIDIYNSYKKNDWNNIHNKLSELEYHFINILNNIINEIKKINKNINIEKEELKKNVKILKKKMNSLSNDFFKNVEELDKLKNLLTKESAKNEILLKENEELSMLYKKLNDDYNDKVVIIQNNEYELKNLQEQLIEKNQTKTRTEKINYYLKTDLNYLNTSLDQATHSLNELNHENMKNKIILKELTEKNIYLKNEICEKEKIIENLEKNLESKNNVINELKEFNEILIKNIEEKSEYNEHNKNVNEEDNKRKINKNKSSSIYKEVFTNEPYEEINKKELVIIINKLENDNEILVEEMEMLKNNFDVLKEKKKELEEIINSNDIALNKKEIELNDAIIEKEKVMEEIKRYKIKCIQIIDICFNKDFNIVDIREKITAIFENEDEEIIDIINCHKSMLYNNKIEKSNELQDDTISLEQDKVIHIEEMSKKNEELIKKNEEIWKLNKYIEDLNRDITDKNYIIIKNQQDIENKDDLLEKNKNYINFLKDQIKLLCNNIDENNLFDINNVKLSPALRSIIKRSSFNNNIHDKHNEKEKTNYEGIMSEDILKKSDIFDQSEKRLSDYNNQEHFNFYDENEVKIEEMKLEVDELNDKLKNADSQIKILKQENNDLIEKCEFLREELKNTQGTKRHLMLCESRLNILQKELEDKQKKIDAQNKTVDECVDIYVEENSENFNKILELKKENEKYKIEINISNDEIFKLKNEVQIYKNDIKNLNSTLDFYKSIHDELMNEFNTEESHNVYYIKLCEHYKKENENFREHIKSEEENKKQLLNSIMEIRNQLNKTMKENYEITLDLEFFQMQNSLLKDSCNYYKERESILINNIDENNDNLKIIENYKEENLKVFIKKLKEEIQKLHDEINKKSKTIVSLKYQIKEYHFEEFSKKSGNLQNNEVEEIININNMTYIQNNLCIYINLFKSVLFIISEILFFTDPTNSLYFEILTLLKLKNDNESEAELDTTIQNFKFSKIDCDNIFQSVLKSKHILREKLQLLQLKIC